MASQTTFVDPSTTTPQADPGNIGNGTMSTPLVSSSTLTENFTITCTSPGGSGIAQFSVVGSVSGNIGTATSNAEFVDTNKKVRFTITAGGTAWAVGDKFTFTTTQGTPLNKANFDNFAATAIIADADDTDTVDGIHAWTDGTGRLIPLPAGTKMVFFQAAAPTGWTQVTTYNDKTLRVVSTAGGGNGGIDGLSTPPSTAHNHGITMGGNHYHGFTGGSNILQGGTPYASTTTTDGNHDHNGFVTTAGPTAFSPAYIDVIVCSKN